MKTTLYILTLFLLLQSGFGEENLKPIEDHIFGGLTASYSNIENQNTVSFGIKMINNKYMRQYRNYQLDFASFDWQNQDFYNKGKTSYSYLLSSIKSVYTITILINEKKLGKNEYVTIPFYALCGITNGKIGYTLIEMNTSKSSFLNTSIFSKSKLDYFIGQEQNWC